MKIIPVKLKTNPYNIYIGYNLIKNISRYLKKLNLGNLGIVISSEKILRIYNPMIKRTFPKDSYRIVKVADGEKAKSKASMFRTIESIAKYDGFNKKLFIICLGGGTIGDLGGFIASLYKRGIPYVQIPTTLLSQIDSSIGGKTAIDLPDAKNILGSFYQPEAVFIDPVFLATLTPHEIKQGMAEVIKYGIIKDKKFFNYLARQYKNILNLKRTAIMKIIETCVKIKADIIKKDEYEKKGIRTILNFGHTFAHALESSLKYKKITHGEAVSIGMLYAAKLSWLMGKCSAQEVGKVLKIIKLFSLPTEIAFNDRTIYKSLSYDKKFLSGKIRMVLLRKIGKVEVINNIPKINISRALKIL
ncbi:MAG: 3-dehydroquinate synthase [Candidatus Omnitrophica bacterium]|jgi:3-dehydroquinate synthase|nr:3-dehydroquinate synthase [Candidatus Omnitrophota bacterium]